MEQRFADAWAHCRVAAQTSPPTRWSPKQRQLARVQLQKLAAAVAMQRQWWPMARKLFGKLAVDHPKDADILRGLGMAAFHEGDIEIAVEKIKRAGELSPDAEPYHLIIARPPSRPRSIQATLSETFDPPARSLT